MMIQNGKANVMGKQPNKYRWIASADFGKLVANGYQNSASFNQAYNIFGPQAFTLNEALEQYIKVKHPEISKVANAPFWLLKIIAFVSGNKELKEFIPMFEYFETTKETGTPDADNMPLGKSTITLVEWLNG